MSSYLGFRSLALGCLLLGSVACSKSTTQATPPPAEQAPAAVVPAAPVAAPASTARYDAKTMYQSRCVVCHGQSGMGDGPGAAALNPKPRNYTDATWQASVSDEQIKSVIVNGGAAVGKSPIMPGSPDLQSKPEVVDELVKIVRGFKKS
jgi:mono/diheme cytochrome c family protein